MVIRDYEDVGVYTLDADTEQQLLERQNECTFAWATGSGAPMAVSMSYLVRNGHFWLTASSQRKRIPAIRRDGRVAIVVTSTGTALGPNKTLTYQGRAVVHDDRETKAWFYPALAERLMGRGGPERVAEFMRVLDSPRRVVIEVTPGLRVGYDGAKMAGATAQARRATGAERTESGPSGPG
jgi:nitroimidazol reductase NimA-like FMN-containing flavoprotein (pyridoxamine 5'-phosphate oxidase superfamily)